MSLILLRRFWPAIPIALLVLALVLTRSTNARHRAEVQACAAARLVDEQSLAELRADVVMQNATVERIGAEGAARGKAAADALARAKAAELPGDATRERLIRSAARVPAQAEPCTISPGLMMSEDQL